ncbi:hypothetical protein PG987_004903 [Apiospora arundinis]
MAETIGLASGLLALATFALKSSVALSTTIRDYQHHPKRVRELIEELDALSDVLRLLTDTTATDIDLSFLAIPLRQCDSACREFEAELKSCSSRSGSDRTSFRDWMKLRYMGDDIDEFRQMLGGYKSTISIALNIANLRKTTVTIEKLEGYRNLIKATTDDLQDHLHSIDGKLDTIASQTVTESDLDTAEVQLMKKERLSTQQCLAVCSQLSDHIDRIQLEPPANQISSSGKITSDSLQQCKDTLRRTVRMLEKNMLSAVDECMAKSSMAGDPSQAARDYTRLREEWTTVRHCIDHCSMMDDALKENISNIENYATGDDAIQYMVSTDGSTLHGKNRGFGFRPKQVGGHLSDVSLQHISTEITRLYSVAAGNTTPSRTSTPIVHEEVVEEHRSSEYRERYGPGMKLTSNPPPSTDTSSSIGGGRAK